jgi:sulfur carrier protein ThiS
MVATQGLFILNDDSVMAAAEATARRLLANKSTGGQEAVVDRMFELVLSKRATEEDRIELLAFIGETEKRLTEEGETDADLRAWSIACHALFASSRFQILE